MRLVVLTVLLSVASSLAAQAPLPTALKEGKRVYITGEDVERKHIDHLAKELQKRKRFEVVGDREQADLVFLLARGRPGATVIVPVAGLLVGVREGAFRLIIYQRRHDDALWEDSREGDGNGTITALVKRLHEALNPKR
jgi:hypothetical protein